MRERYDEELKALNEEIMQMATLSEIAIDKAVSLMCAYDKDVSEEVFDLEEQIDLMENRIQTHCLRLILEQQPVATDLRIISSALKMITDLERIGDQARDIAEICSNFKETYDFESIDHIKKMAKATTKIIKNTINSFIDKDIVAARSIEDEDDIVDNYFVKVRDDLIKQIENKHHNAPNIIDFIMIAKYLERIADHAVNISRWVIFAIEG
ncbi:phosphate transport system regulatory protein PhoU [Peptoniphilus sp. ING2-D1G]|nr:phosphate transport system regulatory protein PhoU [Peptoniphilus sp. ING2-D1G]